MSTSCSNTFVTLCLPNREYAKNRFLALPVTIIIIITTIKNCLSDCVYILI